MYKIRKKFRLGRHKNNQQTYVNRSSNFLTKLIPQVQKDILRLIVQYSEPLFDGYWYTSGQLFLLASGLKDHVIGLFFGYIVLGKITKSHGIVFHQYPSGTVKFKQKVTVQGQLHYRERRIDAEYILGRRAPWRPLTILRDPPSFQKALIYAAAGDVDALEVCFKNGYDINYRFDEFQKSTVLDIATVHNQPQMVRFLLRAGADANIKP
eukprot:UN23383